MVYAFDTLFNTFGYYWHVEIVRFGRAYMHTSVRSRGFSSVLVNISFVDSNVEHNIHA